MGERKQQISDIPTNISRKGDTDLHMNSYELMNYHFASCGILQSYGDLKVMDGDQPFRIHVSTAKPS